MIEIKPKKRKQNNATNIRYIKLISRTKNKNSVKLKSLASIYIDRIKKDIVY